MKRFSKDQGWEITGLGDEGDGDLETKVSG